MILTAFIRNSFKNKNNKDKSFIKKHNNITISKNKNNFFYLPVVSGQGEKNAAIGRDSRIKEWIEGE